MTQSNHAASGDQTLVPIVSHRDIIIARQKARIMAEAAGFSGSDQTIIASAISEVARTIVDGAGEGEIFMKVQRNTSSTHIDLTARDSGGRSQRRRDAHPRSGGVSGLGLDGVRRLMDSFEIFSEGNAGTTIRMRKNRSIDLSE